jgi:hypothetical protein
MMRRQLTASANAGVPALGEQMGGQPGHAPRLLPPHLIARDGLQHIRRHHADHHLLVCDSNCLNVSCGATRH